MRATVKFFATLREIVGDWSLDFSLPEETSVAELLGLLTERFGGKFREYVYDDKGDVHDYLIFLLNGESINSLRGFGTRLKEADTLVILPPIGGG